MKRGVGARIAALALLSFVGACGTVLGLDDYSDAAAVLCACPGFEKMGDCAARAHTLLAAASDEAQQDWLDRYDKRQCGTVCERADECYNDVPGCGDRKVGCECCVWDGSALKCAPKCQTCRTCSVLAALPSDPALDCVSSRALLQEIKRCACNKSVCAGSCTGFCQNNDALTDDPGDICRQCLAKDIPACEALAVNCFKDKPG